jgi:hypothetical protein
MCLVPQHGEADGLDGVSVEGGEQNVQQPTTRSLRMRPNAALVEEVHGPLSWSQRGRAPFRLRARVG